MNFRIFSQKETNNRFFGNNPSSGITFTGNNVQNILNTPNNLNIGYSTSMTDTASNLMFLVNDSVRDKNFRPMPGTLPIDVYSFQRKSIYTVKMPNITNKYYIFYKRTFSMNEYILSYAIVDMNQNNGLGVVTQMDIPIDTNNCNSFTVVNKSGTDNFWLVQHKPTTDSFFCKLVNNIGISDSYVISKAGLNNILSEYSVESMATSPNGKMIAETNYKNYPGLFPITRIFIEVYNFNSETGIITPKIKGVSVSNLYILHNDIEFSPDNKLIYTHFKFVAIGLQPTDVYANTLFQSNLCYTNESDFSRYTLPVFQKSTLGSSHYMTEPKLFPNKQISFGLTSTPYIGFLNNSNIIGNHSNFRFGTNQLITNIGKLTSYYHHNLNKAVINNISYKGGCFPAPQTFKITNDTIYNIDWNFGDPNSGNLNFSNGQNVTHIFSNPGKYEVTANVYNSLGNVIEQVKDTIEQKDSQKRLLYNYPIDTVICSGQNIKIELDVVNGFFEWWKKSTINGPIENSWVNNTMNINSTGYYYVKMRQNDCEGCHLVDSIYVFVIPTPSVNLGLDKTLCDIADSIKIGTIPQFYSPPVSTQYLWSNGQTSDSIYVNQPGTYLLQLINSYNNVSCSNKDSINILQSVFNYKLPNDTILCNQGSYQLSVNNTLSVQYLWSTGNTSNTILVNNSGLYWLRTTYGNCVKWDSINLQFINTANQILGADTTLCSDQSLTLNPNLNNASYLWNNGSTNPTLTVSNSGTYWVTINQGMCIIKDTIKVNFNPVPVFSLGNDSSICEREGLVLSTGITNASYLWNNGTQNDSLFVNSAGLFYVTVTKNNCNYKDSIIINILTNPKVFIGNDTSICSNSNLILNAIKPEYISHLWQDGSTNSTFNVTAQGRFIVQATNINGCKSKDTINVIYSSLPNFNLGSDTSICQNDSIFLNASVLGATSYLWNTGDTTSTIYANNNLLYWCKVNKFGCIYKDSLLLGIKPNPKVNLGLDTTLCDNNITLLNASNFGATYRWQDSSTDSSFLVNKAGIYFVSVELNKCTTNDSISIQYKKIPFFKLGNDTTLCEGNSITLQVKNENVNYNNYLWNTGLTTPTINVNKVGLYSLEAKNYCGRYYDTIIVSKGICKLYIPSGFTPNNDGVNDLFRAYFGEGIKEFSLKIYNRWGIQIFNSTNPLTGWDGKFNNILQPNGTYVYLIKFTENITKKKIIRKGTVQIIK